MPRLSSRNGLAEPGDVDQLVSDSMSELLDGARLPTLEAWVSRGRKSSGRDTRRSPCASGDRVTTGPSSHRPGVVCGGCSRRRRAPAISRLLGRRQGSTVGLREEEALTLYRQAGSCRPARVRATRSAVGATRRSNRARAWALARTPSWAKRPARAELDATEAVQTADKRLLLGLRFGRIESLSEAKEVAELLPAVPDPVLRCSFGSTFSCALNLAAEYARALDVSMNMSRDAVEYRVEFALPYGYLMSAAALAGLTAFRRSARCAFRVAGSRGSLR